MSTVRIQLRRGLEADWTSVNPILAAGEVGLESDTGKFKFGDGSTAWSALDYALSNTLGDYVLLADIGQPNGVASLNSSGKVPASQLDISELSQDAVNTALVAGTGLDKTYDDNSNTITLDIDSTVATKQFAAQLLTNATKSNITITGDQNGLTISAENGVADSTTDDLVEGSTNKYFTDERAQDAVNSALVAGSNLTKSYNDNANTITLDLPAQVSLTTSIEAPTAYIDDLNVYNAATIEDLTVSGNLTVNGTSTTVNAVDLVITDPLIYIGENNQANSLDLGIVASFNNGTYQHTGLVKDATDGTWRLFSGVTTEPTTTVDFTTYTKDNLQLGHLDAATAKIGNVTNTEISYLANASSNIQLQIGSLDGRVDTIEGDLPNYAPLLNPAFTGTVTGVTKSMVGLGYVDNTSDLNKPLSNAAVSALLDKADLNGPTFIGTVTLPSTTSIGSVSDVEIAYLDGVTSNIQTQINGKANTQHSHILSDITDITASNTELNILDGATLSTTELNYVDGVTSSIQTQLNSKASSTDLSNHTSSTTSVHGIVDTAALATKTYADNAVSTHEADTTSVHGIADTTKIVLTTDTGTVTSTMIANGTIVNEDINASAAIDQSKISGLTSDLAAKAPLAGPTFTGTVVLPSTTSIGNVSATEIGYVDGVTSAIQTQLDSKLASSTAASTYAPIASPTFTGTVAGITKSMVGLGNVDNTSDANKPVSTATQTALDAKLSLSGGTMTGALTLSGAPSADLHAATKAYVDNVAASINFHQPVRVATTGNITLSGTQTIDGVSLSVGDRVLVKDQTDQKTNGIYVVASSTWSRATDADNTPAGELAGGDFTLVLEGTVNSGYGYVCSNTSTISIGTTNITYAAFNAAKAVTAGSGLTESTPGTLDIATGGVTSAMIADGTIVNGDISASAAIAASKIAGTAITAADTGTVTSTMIADGTIVNADISATAAIAATKISGTAITAADTGTVTSTMIADGTIVDGDINASAAIAQSKISGLTSALSAKAPIADPTFTGTVTVASAGIAFTDGTQSKEGVPSRTPIVQKTASYTLSALTERDSLVEVASASATTLTIPADSTLNFPVGTSIDILQTSTGQVTVAGAVGVTVNSTPGLKLRTQWSSATLFKRAANTWVVYGDLTA